MLRVGRSAVYRLIAARQKSIKVCRSRRVSVASIRYVAATSSGAELVEACTERFRELVTPEVAEEACDVLSAWPVMDDSGCRRVPECSSADDL
jgi:hypothetical protein